MERHDTTENSVSDQQTASGAHNTDPTCVSVHEHKAFQRQSFEQPTTSNDADKFSPTELTTIDIRHDQDRKMRQESDVELENLTTQGDNQLSTPTPRHQATQSDDVSLNLGVQPEGPRTEERRVAFLPPRRISPVFVPPRSAYPVGPPPIGSAYGTPPMGQIGVHYPREIVRIERDYSGGELVQFYPIYPIELEGRITPTQWLDTVNGINEILISAHSLKRAAVHHLLAMFTLYISTFLLDTHYEKEIGRLRTFIDQCNEQLYHSQGLNILWPRSNGFLFLEIEYYARAGPSSAQRLHWDSQPSEEVGLAYVEEKERRSPVASTQRQTYHPNSRNGPTGANTKGYSSNPLASSSKPTNSEQGKVQARETPRVKVGDVLPMGQDDWDDSLLIDAWNAAEQEYMEMHGGTKWKMAPVKFSSLWHSAPIAEKSGDNVDADDSQVSDADHPGEVAMDDYQAPAKSYPDPDLAPEIPTNLALHTGQTDLELGSISLEEAFHKAKEASYALGYWTAVYQMKANEKSAAQHDLAVGAEESDNAEDDAEEFAPTQR
ncbi:hypothetical protein FRC17_009051 [Serendipita sp. 399]|nr:hypothetical protein FRC17_009051 [Serendipita sp. 399]